ncbi:MAG: hypothetical protein NXI04_06030 [Planctomycetaceae bacterium]|nr:hypothetical protein [Planctomycetaceae bacterium]
MSALWLLTAVGCCLPLSPVQAPGSGPPAAGQAVRSVATADEQERPFTHEATQFVKGMVLLLLPQTYTDDDDWGRQKKVQSGLNVDLDGLKVKTSRRWKDVNHGTWQRVDATLVDPQEHFDLKIVILPKQERGISRYRITASVRVRATVRQQQWSYGAKLYSVSADAVADVRVVAELQFRSQLIKTERDSKLRVLPFIETLHARLDSFSLRRVSHAKGALVREFGQAVKGLLQRGIERKNAKLAQKTNGRIQKKPERFEVPAGILGVFGATTEAESD